MLMDKVEKRAFAAENIRPPHKKKDVLIQVVFVDVDLFTIRQVVDRCLQLPVFLLQSFRSARCSGWSYNSYPRLVFLFGSLLEGLRGKRSPPSFVGLHPGVRLVAGKMVLIRLAARLQGFEIGIGWLYGIVFCCKPFFHFAADPLFRGVVFFRRHLQCGLGFLSRATLAEAI